MKTIHITILLALMLAGAASRGAAQPVITQQPQSQTVRVGSTTFFAVTATGTPPLTYQWRKEGAELPGATGAMLALGLARTDQAGSYTVVVRNVSGSVTSAFPAMLTVNAVSSGSVLAWGWNTSGQTTVPNAVRQSGATAIAGGYYHTVALEADGSVVAWGGNGQGQTTVPLAAQSGVAAVAAGVNHTVALKVDGSVLAWGGNGQGQSTVPNTAQSGVVAIAAGSAHTVVLKADGSVLVWGFNGSGQATVPLAAQSGVVAVSAGPEHTVALKSDGSVLAWGANSSGQTAVPVTAQSGVIAIAAGGYHTAALKSDGSVVVWGNSSSGQTNVPFGAQSGVVAIVAGQYHTVALRNDGSVVVWGSNSYGQTAVPAEVSGGVTGIAAGANHTVVLVNPAFPAITAHPTDLTVNAGQSTSFSVTATAYPFPSYQWRKNGVNIPGATSATYSLPFARAEDVGSYTVVVSNPAGSVTSAPPAVLTVTLFPPIILTQPASLTVNAGQSASFTVAATVDPLTFQWRKAGVDLTGATSATYSLPFVQADDAGGYSVVVSNPSGSVTSAPPAVLTVTLFLPTIVTQPTSLTVNAGQSAGFSVTATSYPSTYQWRKDGLDIPDATGTTCALGLARTNQAGSYTVVVSNPAGSVTSAPPAMLTVNPISAGWVAVWGNNSSPNNSVPWALVQGGATAVAAGHSHTVALRNDGAVVAWGYDGNGRTAVPVAAQSGMTAIAAGQSHTVALKNDGSVLAWGYNGSGQTTVPVAAQSRVAAIAAGANHTVALKNDGSVVAWGDNGSGQMTVPLAAQSGITAIAAGQSHTVALKNDGSVLAWGHNGSGQTTVPVAAQSGVTAIAAGAFYTVALKNDGTIVAWGLNGSGQTTVPVAAQGGITAIAAGYNHTVALKNDGSVVAWGESSSGLTTVPIAAQGRITGIAAGVSHTAVLLIPTFPTILSQPTELTVGEGQRATLTMTATGFPSYQWRRDGVDIPGETGATYFRYYVQPQDAGAYTVVVGNLAGSVTSAPPALLTVTLLRPTIVTQPISQTVNAGQYVTFSVTGTGYGLSYQWRRDGVNLPGENGNALVFFVSNLIQEGSYSVVVSNPDGSVTSQLATLTIVRSPPVVVTQPASQTVNAGQYVALSVTATGFPFPSYQWRKDGVDLVGATDASFNVPFAQTNDSGSYTVVVSNYFGSVTSDVATLIVNAYAPVIRTQPASQTVMVGDTIALSVEATGAPPPTYQWQFNGADIAGATDWILQLENVTRSQAGAYTVVVSNEGGSVTSAVATLTVNFKVQFSATRYSGSETGIVATITVRRGGDGPEVVTVNYATSDGTATAGQDYTAAGGTLTFGPGETEKNFTVPILDDALTEGVENLRLSLSGLTGPAVFGANTKAVLSLFDDETPPPTNVVATAISAGQNHTLALRRDGSLWAWGDNGNGELGDGTFEYRPDPVLIGSDLDWSAVAAGNNYSLALKNDGSLWAWGVNWSGQLGFGTFDYTNQPARVDQCLTWTAIAASRNRSMAIRKDGSLWVWGRGVTTPTRLSGDNDWHAIATAPRHTLALKTDGSLWALDESFGTIPEASPVGADLDWVTVTAGGDEGWDNNYGHAVAFKTDGSLWAWGDNGSGQLGDGTGEYRADPVRIGEDNDWVAISAGQQHTLALKRDGTLWGWGANNDRQLGDGTRLYRLEPALIGSDHDWIAIDAGGYRSVALKVDGSLWQWGSGSPWFSPVPRRAAPEHDWSAIAAGGNQSLALQTNGSLWAWGDGQVFLTRVEGAGNWQTMAAGQRHALAIGTDGSLWARGENWTGQLGDGTYDYQTNLIRIGTASDWREVTAGSFHSAAIKTDHSLWAWGGNDYGQLGNGTTAPSNEPQRIGQAHDWRYAAAGYGHTVALKNDGGLWAWGNNGYGQLGIGTSGDNFSDPVRIGSDSDWRSLCAGTYHAIAIKTDGSLWAWGWNVHGQLGLGDFEDRSSPVRIGTDNDWAEIVAGHLHTLGLKTDGSLWAWGGNWAGQLGNGATAERIPHPTRVGTDNNWVSVAVGESHNLARKTDGSVWAWGNNDSGQTGDATGWVPSRVGSDIDWGPPSPVAGPGAVRFTDSVRQPGGRLDLFFSTTLNDSYYLLLRGDSPTTISQTVAATLGDCAPRVLTDPAPVTSRASAFYRILAVPLNQPLDSDGDGIDDVYELRHRVALNPLNPSDATEDFDGDGRSNLQEYRDGTDPQAARQIVSAGNFYTALLKTDGSLWTFGDGPATNSAVPMQLGTDNDWSSVAVIRDCCAPGLLAALKADHSLWTWNGIEMARTSPDNDWASLSAGGDRLMLVKTDGSLWIWRVSDLNFTRVDNTYNWQTVAAGGQHTLALKTDGSLWVWGYNEWGLGLGDGVAFADSPTRVGTDNDWIAIAASGDTDIFDGGHSLALKSDGSLWAWGDNEWGQLGLGFTGFSPLINIPTRVGTNANWAALAVSGANSMARQRDGGLWVWGDGVGNQPTRVGTNEGWTAFATGGDPHSSGSKFAVALRNDGSLWSLLMGGGRNAPTVIGHDSDWAAVTAGGDHTLALKANGSLWAWGANYSGQLGDGTTDTIRIAPVLIGGGTDWALIAANYYHSVALKADGTLWAWGYNGSGQLGNGTTLATNTLQRIGSANDWRSATAGANHTLALKGDGSLWAWGENGAGQLGVGMFGGSFLSPVRTGTANNWRAVAAGSAHTAALKNDGSLWAWGENGAGQLGVGDFVNRSSPVRIGAENDWSSVAAGYVHALALKTDRSLWVWGYNAYGQLGDGSFENRTSPVRIGTENDWVGIAAGASHTLGLKADGSLWAWGLNAYGQLGDGTLLDRSHPVRIENDTDWSFITAGANHSIARKIDGTLWSWGGNWVGQLGITTDLKPTRLGLATDWGSPP